MKKELHLLIDTIINMFFRICDFPVLFVNVRFFTRPLEFTILRIKKEESFGLP